MTDMADMTRAEILDIWKGFVRNMSDQGAVVPFAHEIERRVRNELLYRLEAAEKERELWAVIRDGIITPDHLDAGKIVSTKLPLSEMVAITNRLEAAEKERDALRAKIEAMEKQEPVWFIDERGEPKRYHKSKADYCKYGGLDLLYALPGAKGEL